MNATKRVLKYLKDSHSYGIKYSKVSYFHLIGYLDSYFDGDKEHGVSTSGYLMKIGSAAITWRSWKQSVLADSTIEAEYVAATQATKKSFGFIKYLKTCKRNKWLQRLSLLTTLLQFNWPRIQNSMIEPNISTPNTTLFDIMLRPKPFIWHIVLLHSKLQISLLKHWGCQKFENFKMQLGMSDVPSD